MTKKFIKIRKIVRWSHFERKNYCAFRSLGLVIGYGMLSVSTLASTPTGGPTPLSEGDNEAAWYEDGGGGTVDLDELEVTTSMVSLAAGRRARIVAVVSQEEIAAASVSSPADVLKLIPGVDVRQRGGFGVQTDVGIDGSTFDQVTILLNGVNISSPQIGHYSADWPVALADIERIEVLEGAASRVVGGSSLMGAINIVTRGGQSPTASVAIEGGQYGTFGAAGQARFSSGASCWHLSLGGRRSDGGTTNSDFRRGQAFARWTHTSSRIDLNAQMGWSDMSHGANTFYSAAYPNQHDALQRTLVSVGAVTKGRVRVEPLAYWHRLYDHFQLIKGTSTGENFHRTDVVGGRVNAYADWKLGATTVGVEARHEAILSSNLGKPLGPDKWVHVHGTDSAYYTKSDSRTNYNVYLEHNVNIGRWSISAGLTGAVNTGMDHKMRFYPGVDVNYSPSAGWRMYVNWNKSYRMPTFTDLYYKSPTHEGNRDLRPERMMSVQAGAAWQATAIAIDMHGFYHRGRNMLDWVMFTPDDVFHSTGFDLDNFGATVQATARLDLLFGARQPFTRATVGYTAIHQDRHDDVAVYKSNYALEYLRHKLVAQVQHRVWGALSATWSLRYAKRNGSYLEYADGKSTGTLHPYSPYAVLDLKLEYDASRWCAYVSATNLTNHKYYDFGNIPQPGLWVMAGAEIKF